MIRNILAAVLTALLVATAPGTTVPSEFNVTAFGAVGDGQTMATAAIQQAIDACAAAGGGRVVLPAGTYLSGPLFLRSNIEFHLSSGAVLAGSGKFSDYPVIPGRWEGIERRIHASLLTARDAVNVSITGYGTIDGRGAPWWDAARATLKLRRDLGITGREPDNPPGSPLAYPRPRAIYLQNCRNVRLTGITVMNSPSWTIHPVYCEDVVIEGITITAPSDSPNTDGIDPDSCRNVRISNCHIACGDDGIIIKSGYNADGRRVGRPSENIVITNCTIGPAIAAVGIGSETAGGVHNVTVSNCVFEGTHNGLRVKSARGRGATVENFSASNIVMRNISEIALSITTYYDSKDRTPQPVDEATPTFRNIEWSNLIIDGTDRVAVIEGLPERFLEDVSLDHVTVRGARRGVSVIFTDGLRLTNWSLDVLQGPPLQVEQSRALELVAIRVRHPRADAPVIKLTDVAGACLRGCTAAEGTKEFLRVTGPGSHGIVLQSNDLAGAAQPTVLADGAKPEALSIIP